MTLLSLPKYLRVSSAPQVAKAIGFWLPLLVVVMIGLVTILINDGVVFLYELKGNLPARDDKYDDYKLL